MPDFVRPVLDSEDFGSPASGSRKEAGLRLQWGRLNHIRRRLSNFAQTPRKTVAKFLPPASHVPSHEKENFISRQSVARRAARMRGGKNFDAIRCRRASRAAAVISRGVDCDRRQFLLAVQARPHHRSAAGGTHRYLRPRGGAEVERGDFPSAPGVRCALRIQN